MGHLCISIGWVADDSPSTPISEMSHIPFPALDLNKQSLNQTLDTLELQTLTMGQDVMPSILFSLGSTRPAVC